MQRLGYYVPGAILILIAIMIVAVPEILVAFVAACMIMAGVAALYVGHMMGRSKTGFRKTYGWFFRDDGHDWRFVRESILRRWH